LIRGIFFILIITLTFTKSWATGIWIPKGSLFADVAEGCYIPLAKAPSPQMISKTTQSIENKQINELALDSTMARLSSVECLRKKLTTKEDREALSKSYESNFFIADHFVFLEKKLILANNRDYHLTPVEEVSVSEYFRTREVLTDAIRRLTLDAIVLSDPDWQKQSQNWQEEIRSRYGALLREREKFLLSLSIESRASYLQFLNQFTEK